MRIVSMRRAMMVMALVGGAALVAGPAVAQTPPGPPVCGAVGSLMNMSIAQDGTGAQGDNLVSVPAKGPVNKNPGDPANNGFQQLCKRFGLVGTTSAVIQFDAQLGNITTFYCNQSAAPPWTPGQAALIRPTADKNGRIPGVECSAPYISYTGGAGAAGDNLFPVPLTIVATDPEQLCGQLALAAGDSVTRFDAAAGNIAAHICGSTAVWNLVMGEAVLVQPLADRGPASVTIY